MKIVIYPHLGFFYKIIHNSGYGSLYRFTSFIQIAKHEKTSFLNDDDLDRVYRPFPGT